MSDYGEQGTRPVDDAVVEDPPTDEEVLEAQRRHHPDQARTARHGDPTEHLHPDPGTEGETDDST